MLRIPRAGTGTRRCEAPSRPSQRQPTSSSAANVKIANVPHVKSGPHRIAQNRAVRASICAVVLNRLYGPQDDIHDTIYASLQSKLQARIAIHPRLFRSPRKKRNTLLKSCFCYAMRIAASCPKLLKGAGRWHAEALDSSVARAHDAISLGRGRRSWGAVVAGR